MSEHTEPWRLAEGPTPVTDDTPLQVRVACAGGCGAVSERKDLGVTPPGWSRGAAPGRYWCPACTELHQ